jgi:hypothetical protein
VETWLQEALTAPTFHLLLCGAAHVWDDTAVEDLRRRHEPFLTVHRLAPADGQTSTDAGDLLDTAGTALFQLRVRGAAHLIVRPDGHIGYRADDADLSGAARYLDRWLSGGGDADGAPLAG